LTTLATVFPGIYYDWGAKKLNGSRDMSRPFQGWFVVHGLGLAINIPTKFEVSISTRYKRRYKCGNGVVGIDS